MGELLSIAPDDVERFTLIPNGRMFVFAEDYDNLLRLYRRMESTREDFGTLQKIAQSMKLIEHKADQALQGQYTKEQLLGVILHEARKALMVIKEKP